MAKDPQQGEIWSMDFGSINPADPNIEPIEGHEQGGFRPALILSRGAFNTIGLNLAIVAAITTKPKGWEFEIPIAAPEGGLKEDSFVLAHQIRTVDHNRLKNRLGQVSPDTLDTVLGITQRLISRTRRIYH